MHLSAMAQLLRALSSVVVAATKPPLPPVDRTLPEHPITTENLDENIKEAKLFYDMNGRDTHVAVVGAKGVGKSSIINALCSRASDDPGAAPVGRSNSAPVKYRNQTMERMVLWEMPGAGVGHPSLTYFVDKKLYAFDLLMLVSDRFHRVDFDVARCALRLGRRIVFVRTKADEAVMRISQRDQGPKIEHVKQAFKILREEVTASFREGLRISGLGDKEGSLMLFIVSSRRYVGGPHVYSLAGHDGESNDDDEEEEEDDDDDDEGQHKLDEDKLYFHLVGLVVRGRAVRRTRTTRLR